MAKFKIFYWTVSSLLFVDLCFFLGKEISLAGYWTDKVFFWIWVTLTIAVIGVNFKEDWAKGYGLTLGGIVVVTMIPMMIPFLYLLNLAIGQDTHVDLGNGIRVQEVSTPPYGMKTLKIVEALGPIEHVIGEAEFTGFTLDEVKTVKLVDSAQVPLIEIQFADTTLVKEIE